jgi:chitinase
MRRNRRTAVLSVATAAALTLLGLAVNAAHADNGSLENTGFETGNLNGWTCDSTAGTTGDAHTGSYALRGTTTNDSNAQCSQTVTLQANTAYALTAYVKGSYVYLGASGSVNASAWTPGTNGTYQKLSVTFTTGATTTTTIYLHGWYAQGPYQADDVTLTGPGGATPTATASPSATASATASPSPSRTPSPSPSTTPPASGPLPKHELTGYWQNFTNGAKALRLADVPANYDLVAVAFADTDAGLAGGVKFSVDPDLSGALGGYSDADLKADVRTLHGRGQHVVLSVGGQNGTVSVADSTAATNFANSVSGIISSFGFDGVDIDLENGVNATYMAQALHALSSKVGSGLIVTMAPQTIDMQSTGNAYFSLALNIKDILTVVHTQYYNSGSMLGCDQNQPYGQGNENFIVALACIQLQSALRPDQIALGLPASSSAAGSGYVDPSVVDNALDCLARGTNCGSFKPGSTWPSIRGAMTWSINWDAANGYAFANTVKPHLNNLP